MAGAASEERRLVRRLRAGDEEAFDRFAASYLPGLYRFAAARLARDLDLVPDLVQSALAKAIDRLESWRGEAPLFTWLCACLKNEIASHYRRAGRRPVEVELDGGAAASAVAALAAAPEAEERLLRLESAELVHAALDAVPERYARALEWKYLEGASVAEIGERLGTTSKAAESLLGRARDAFRDAYTHLDGPPATFVAAPARAETA
jgi:RNA polymerase sigma-70 factor (ECF subfamily)